MQEFSQLRFMTCGSVDDGKSTLIGRLLIDAGAIFEDQYAAVAAQSHDGFDYSLLLDGLSAEREQKITIDVAYRYFSTNRRSFVVADSPGHEQFTQNMATAASVSDAAVLLIDARKGLQQQSRRHATIVALMGIRQIALIVNKMDLVGNDEGVFTAIAADFAQHAEKLHVKFTAIPASARLGHNVVDRADTMKWYEGPTLLQFLEEIDVAESKPQSFRFPIQRVNVWAPDFRGYQGTVAGGAVKVNDHVIALPSGVPSKIAQIITFDGNLPEAHTGDPVTLVLADQIEAGRGTVLSTNIDAPCVSQRLIAHVFWCSDNTTEYGRDLLLRTATDVVPARVSAIRHRLNVVSLLEEPAISLGRNDIGQVVIATDTPVVVDRYAENRRTGALLLIDRVSNETVAIGMVLEPIQAATNVFWQSFDIHRSDRPTAQSQTPAILWLTGPSGAGKSTVANAVERLLVEAGCHAYVLDGDNVRHGLNRDLGFSASERSENVRRLAEVGRILADAGMIAIVAAIAPYEKDRRSARLIAGEIPFYEVFLDTPLEVCAARDKKGLYRDAAAGKIRDFTGVGAPYERPLNPDLRLDGAKETVMEEAQRILSFLIERKHFRKMPQGSDKQPR
jgi:bifunctional enzyme CysN/CysC